MVLLFFNTNVKIITRLSNLYPCPIAKYEYLNHRLSSGLVVILS